LQTDGRQDPNAQPGQVENDKETLGPGGEAEQRGKSVWKSGDKLFGEMQALAGQAD